MHRLPVKVAFSLVSREHVGGIGDIVGGGELGGGFEGCAAVGAMPHNNRNQITDAFFKLKLFIVQLFLITQVSPVFGG